MNKKRLIILSIVLISLYIVGLYSAKNSEVEQEKGSINEVEKEITLEDLVSEETPLSKADIDDLVVLGKIWGYLKYYHPTVAKGNLDWDAQLLSVIPKVLLSENSKERDEVLTNWITDLGPYKSGENPTRGDLEIIMEAELDWITNSNLEESLVNTLLHIKDAERSVYNHYVSLAYNVGNPKFNEKPYAERSYPTIEYRLLSLFRYWNIIEYFFPYRNLIEEDWDDILTEFIPKFLYASNEQEYKLTALEIITRVQDTHAIIWNEHSVIEKFWGENFSPFILAFVEDKAVVIDYYDEAIGKKTGINIGDVITKINHMPVKDVVKEKLKYVPGSNQSSKLRDIARRLLRTNDTVMSIEVENEGKNRQVEIEMFSPSELGVQNYDPYQLQIDNFKQLDSDIAYLYVGSLKKEQIPDVMEKVNSSSGLIIDLRGYPLEFIVYTLGEYLLPKSTEFTKTSIGSIKEPGMFHMTAPYKVGRENTDYYKGKIIVLVNEFTQSQAEFTAMAFQVAPNVKVVGSTTAGADGDVSFFTLPGNIQTGISGIGIYYPDGTETQRIGIVPDVIVTPTIEGIRENRDEVLEKAIEILHSGQN